MQNDLKEKARFWQTNLSCIKTYRTINVTVDDKVQTTILTSLIDTPDYKLHLTTAFESGYALLFLSDANEVEAAKLLLEIELAILNKKLSPAPNKIITFSKKYFINLNIGGLIFLTPEDLEIFEPLKHKTMYQGTNLNCLTFLLLTTPELKRYEKSGFEEIINIFAEESRDFLSIK